MKNLNRICFIYCVTSIIVSMGAFAHSPQKNQKNIEKIKQQILQVATEASSKVKFDDEDNDPQVRTKLDLLVAQLVSLAPEQSQEQKLKRVVGAWKSVWSDLTYFSDIPLANSVYQVVFPNGYYYNLSNNGSGDGSIFGGIIKGEYQLADPALRIKFVKFAKNRLPFIRGTDLATAAMRAELGEFDELVHSPALGFESIFEQIYVDEDLRIATGKNFDGFNVLFVLKRVSRFD